MPYVFLSATSALAVLLIRDVGAANGFYIFAITNSAIYGGLLLVIVTKHIRENGIVPRRRSTPAFAHALMAALLLIPISAGATIRGPYGIEAIAWGADPLSLTQAKYEVAGAAQGGTGVRVVTWRLWWMDDQTSLGIDQASKTLRLADD